MAADGRLSESEIQESVFKQLRARGSKGLIALHVPNGGTHQQSVVQRVQNKRLGVQKGAPDVMIFYHDKLYCLELKTQNGRASKAQGEMIGKFREQGAIACIAYGLDHAVEWLEHYGLLRGKAQ